MTTLPDGWSEPRLEDVASIRLGRQRSPRQHSGPHMRRYLRAANVTWRGLDISDVKEMNFDPEEFETFRLEEGDLLINEASGSHHEVGKVARFRGEIGDCAFQNTLLRVRPHSVDLDYLEHFLRYNALDGRYLKHARGVGIFHLGRARLADTTVRLPPIDEQDEIVRILDTQLARLDSVLGAVQTIREKAAQFRRSLLRDAFNGQLTQPDSHRSGERPADWTTEQIGNLLETAIGGVWGKDAGQDEVDVRVIRVTELRTGGRIDPSTAAFRSVTKKQLLSRRLRGNDLLLEKSGGGPNTPVGRVGLVPHIHFEAVCANFMMLMRVDPKRAHFRFLHLLLNHVHGEGHTVPLQKATTNIRNLKSKDYLMLEVPTPPLVQQDEIVRILDAQLSRLDDVLRVADRVEVECGRLRRSLLQAAFSGELTREWRESHA